MDARSRRVVVVAHCLLNSNTRVHGIAAWAGALEPVVSRFTAEGIGIVQLPCPEASLLGMDRWAATREQYDTPGYRRHCRDLFAETLDTLEVLVRDGVTIEGVLGVPGSPSCGVFETSEGFSGGRADGTQLSKHVAGSGIFMQELAAAMRERGLDVPFTDAPTRTASTS